MILDLDPTGRFSNRVDAYVRYRPGYPGELLETLVRETGLGAGSVVADIGAGTGISTELLLRSGCMVIAVEPNAAMRAAAESRLGGHPRFRAVDGTAEATGLEPRTVDLVTAGQAVHWFEPQASRREFARILKPGGLAAFFWNTRLTDVTPFLREYEELLRRYGTDYEKVTVRIFDAERLRIYFPDGFRTFTFPNEQVFDFDGLAGRVLSSSYSPAPDHPSYAPMMRELRRLFDRYQEDGTVRFVYETELHIGSIGE